MKKRSKDPYDESFWVSQRNKIIGLGEKSLRKSYYPQLKGRLDDLELLRFLLDSVEEGVFTLRGRDLRVIDANKSGCRIFNMELMSLKGKSILKFMPDEARKAISGKTGEKNSKTNIEAYIAPAKQEKIPVEINVSSVDTTSGKYFIMVVRNIAERKSYEKRIKRSEAMFRMMADYSYDAEIFVGTGGVIHYINPGFKRIIGKPPSRYIGKSVREIDFLRSKERKNALEYIKQLLEGDSFNDRELSVKTAEGKMVFVSVAGQPVKDDQGNLVGAMVSIRDITTRKETDILKTSLLGDIAHSLNNPLATIKASSQLLRISAGKNDQQRIKMCLDMIDQNSDRINNNISSLMMVYSMDKAKIWSLKNRVSIRKVLEEVIDSLSQDIARSDVTVMIDIKEGAGKLFFIEKQMYVLLWNLISNSVKYAGGGDILFSSKLSGQDIVLEVKDNGMGIAKQDIPSIFGMFYRTQENLEGNGLGLSICKNIVDMYGGKIRAFSEGPGRGTLIRVTIPRLTRLSKKGPLKAARRA